MDIKKLRYFVSVAENLSFTAAAEKLYVTQPCLSLQIADLENELGVKLFLRDRHSVRLTVAGIAILKEAKNIIEKSNEIIEIARQAESGIMGKLAVGFLGAPERRFFPIFLNKFRRNFPKIELTLTHFNVFSELDNELFHGNTDIAITMKSEQETLPLINWKTIYTDMLSLVLPYNHPLADKSSNHLSALEHETFVFVDRAFAGRGLDTVLQMYANSGIRPKIRFVPNMQTVLMAVESGEGFSILPSTIPEAYASPFIRFTNIQSDAADLAVIAAWKNDNDNPSIPVFLREIDAMLPLQN